MTRRTRLGLCAAVLVAVIGSEAAIAWRQRAELGLQEHSLEILERRATRLIAERARVRRELRALPAAAIEPEALQSTRGANASAESAAAAWIARVHRLRAAFAADPARRTPELECLSPAEWLELAQSDGDIDASEDALRVMLAHIRGEAKFAFLERMKEALVLYCHAHDGELPASAAQLAEFFETPPPAGALERYTMVRSGKLQAVGTREPIVVEQSLADEFHDRRYALAGAASALTVLPNVHISPSRQAVGQAIERAQRAFANRHGGGEASTPEQLAPFIDPDAGVKPPDVKAFWDSPLRKK